MQHGWYVLAVSNADLAAPVKRFFWPAFSEMFLLMYYPSKSASPATEDNSQATFESMIQLRTEVSCIFENFDMKSSSWIDKHDKKV